MHYVYILKLANGNYYTGLTGDLKRRVAEHMSGKTLSMRNYLPVTLINYVAFADQKRAEDFEYYLKTGSGIAFRNRHLM